MRISDWSSDVCSSDLWATEPLHVVEGFRERHEDQPSRDRQTARCVEMDRAVQDVLRAVRAKSGGDPTRGRADPAARYDDLARGRSEERSAGKECVRTCRSRGTPYN